MSEFQSVMNHPIIDLQFGGILCSLSHTIHTTGGHNNLFALLIPITVTSLKRTPQVKPHTNAPSLGDVLIEMKHVTVWLGKLKIYMSTDQSMILLQICRCIPLGSANQISVPATPK